MNNTTPELAKSAVLDFLNSQFDKKSEKEVGQLTKAIEQGETEKALEIEGKIEQIKDKYQLDTWMDRAANWMAKQIGFGTHISKGIHSSSRGDNINFNPSVSLPDGVVGHQSIKIHKLDASGNAAALPLFSLFDFSVIGDKKIKHFIIDDDENFQVAFSRDESLSRQYFEIFRKILLSQPTQPETSEYNKQTLWNHGNNQYTCLIPLYPSSFTNHLYEKVNDIKFSDEISQKRKNRYSNTGEMQAYPELLDLAVTLIGGSNPQGVSQLMSKQRGRNYLLPSLPPVIEWSYSFNLSKFSDSIFKSKSLAYHSQNAIQRIFNVVKARKNTVDYRDDRKDAIDSVLHILFSIANDIRTNQPAGWSRDYELDMVEKLWLDPMRAEMPDEDEFREERETEEWDKVIVTRFANWLNKLLKDEFKGIKHEFAKPEHDEWQNEIEDMKKRYERAGKGVFL